MSSVQCDQMARLFFNNENLLSSITNCQSRYKSFQYTKQTIPKIAKKLIRCKSTKISPNVVALAACVAWGPFHKTFWIWKLRIYNYNQILAIYFHIRLENYSHLVIMVQISTLSLLFWHFINTLAYHWADKSLHLLLEFALPGWTVGIVVPQFAERWLLTIKLSVFES